MNKHTATFIFVAISSYLVSAFASYVIFSTNNNTVIIKSALPVSISNVTNVSKTQKNGESIIFDQSLPKTEPCPLNGALYSKEEQSWWKAHAPLGIMIENHQEARPQSGLSFADVVYEAVAEGGITRFLAMFYCQDAPEAGPIRSARVYFINFLSEYGQYPLYTHVGGANEDGPANALGELDSLGWTGYNDLNQFSIGFPTFWRDYNRLNHDTATEHTMYSTTGKLWSVAKSRGITSTYKDGSSWDKMFVPYFFKDDSPSSKSSGQTIHVEFWTSDPAYYDDWIYDTQQNIYKRNVGGVAHIDRDTNQQLAAKNIIFLYMAESHANDGYPNNVHLLYQDIGTGKAVVFMDGKQYNATWSKTSRTDRTKLIDESGNPFKFNRGILWFSVLPLDGVLQVK